MEDGCTEVHRHPLCVIIATMNTGTQGAREPNEAFTSRLPLTFVMDEVNEDDLLNILMKKGYERSQCKKVVKAYGKIIDYLKTIAHSEEMVMCITTRHCIGALKLMSIGTAPKEAIRDNHDWFYRYPRPVPRKGCLPECRRNDGALMGGSYGKVE